ncbi:retron St85 family RNA-directed DNA polymerase [Bacteroides oleiciplenus]|uniref:RNA-directed DNA polymerase n=1 Tax=Bacteroides oleiciplenus TaxID=626931 RepID=A0A3E5BCP8_9BACE|nr:retron St85 family RNA-directed DNA polymerase [Bacteroides oleiciplenus]RGN35380.1 RNA-directed DNA polymerase [Bacteroides oleiciplenus]
MNGILIAVLIVTCLLVYKIISASRKQEGYKRWKAGNRDNTEHTANAGITRKGWFSQLFKTSAPRISPWFKEEAISQCANLLGVEEVKLKEILKDVSAHYREFWIGKRRGGYRMISAPDHELKPIQDAINHRILSFVNVHPAATGFRCRMSIADNVRPHLGKQCVLKTDIHDFFGSIRSPRVRKTFEAMGYPPDIAKVLGTLCCLHRCLPQGASTSPALSNIISYEMDKKLSALAAKYGLTYTRYADDLTFSGNVFPEEQILSQVKQIVREEKFEVNHKKTRFLKEHNRKIITGVSISSGVKLTIPKIRKREIRKNVHYILTKGLAEHQRRIGSHDPAYLKRLIGTLCYWRSIEPDNTYVSASITALKSLEKKY